jgi:diguanylate cyclase (GGDEF)-like protein
MMQSRTVRAETRSRHRSEDALPPFSTQDPLTKLLDRTAFVDVLGATLARADEATVLSIRLDCIDPVNERPGHAIGDELQRKAAERLLSIIGGMSLAALLGGDAFAVLQVCGGGYDGAGRLAARVVDRLGAAFSVEAHVVRAAVSVGVARAPEHARGPSQLIAYADLAMQNARQTGRSGFSFFAPEMAAQHGPEPACARLCPAG